MKQNFIKLFLMLIASAFITSVTAQEYTSRVSPEKRLNKTITKQAPIAWDKSVQDILFYEDFPDLTLTGWTATGDGVENWVASETNLAGGEANELWMTWSPQFTGQTRLESPVINTSGYTSLVLTFAHLIYAFDATGYYVRVATSSDGGTTWTDAWELYWDNAFNYAAFETIGLSNSDVGSENFQFSFQFEGESPALEVWAIDNVSLGNPVLLDAASTAILGLEGNISANDEIAVSALVNNFGSETVSFDVTLEISDGTTVVFDDTKSVNNLAFGEVQVDFDTWLAMEGTTLTATVTTELAGDENPDNDQISHDFIVIPENTYCIPSADCSAGDGFSDFAWAGIENYGSGCSDGGYGVFTEMTAEVEIGYTYTATFASAYGDQVVSMWIDFNQDYEFSAAERVLTDFPIDAGGEFFTTDITIPGNGLPGNTTMRIGASYIDPSSPDPCAALTYGEWEDYSVNVTGTSINLNAGVVSIDMAPIIQTGDITPLATVKNFSTESVSFPVTMTIAGTSYSSTVQVSDLGIDEAVQVEFDMWNAATGSYEVEVCTELIGDEVPANDCMNKDVAILAYDAGVATINMNSIMIAGELIPKATVKNNGFETISFPVSMVIEGDNYTSSVDVTDLVAGDELMLEFDTWNATSGDYVFEVETGLINDDYPINNILEQEIYILDEAPVKNIVGEEATGTWCGWCTRGIVYMDSMQMKYPETWIGIAVHSNDPMEDPEYIVGLTSYFPAYPSGIVNRGETIDPADFEEYYLQELERVAPASIQIENKQYNSTTKELTFTVSSTFVAPVTDHRFSAVLVENGVTGTGSDWAQANYYSGGANGSMGGFENMPNPIPAEDMIYDHVGRRVIGDIKGVEGSLPASINAGETHSYEFSTILSEEWDESKMELVGLLLDYNSKRIENGAISHLITSISEQLNNQSFVLYPNPASDQVYLNSKIGIEKVQLLNISGQVMFEKSVSGNKAEISTSEFKPGIYFVKVFSQNNVITRKLVIE